MELTCSRQFERVALVYRKSIGAVISTLGLVLVAPSSGDAALQVSTSENEVEIDSTSVVHGTVVDRGTGEALYGAAVSLAEGPDGTPGLGTRVTGDDGRFVFRVVPPGAYTLSVTLLGYRSVRETLVVSEARDLQVVLRLSVSPVALDPIEVVAEQQLRGPLVGFERRRERGFGTYFTREDIDARAPYLFTDLLRTVPGVRVIPAGQFGENAVRLRGNCRPEIILDGVRTSIDVDIDHVLPPMDVEAVEVYKGPQMPAQFGSNPCGAIVVWTRVPQNTGGFGITWKRVGIVAGFVLLAFIGMR